MSLQERIAALNLNQVGRGGPINIVKQNPHPPLKPARPPPPQLPARSVSSHDVSHVSSHVQQHIGNQPSADPHKPPPPVRAEMPRPSLPPRPSAVARSSQQVVSRPPLPARKSSQNMLALARRDSQESISSTLSSQSSASVLSSRTTMSSKSRTPSLDTKSVGVRAPVYDPTSLPALPPKKIAPKRQSVVLGYCKPSTTSAAPLTESVSPIRPPPLPMRRDTGPVPQVAARRLPPQLPLHIEAVPTPEKISQPLQIKAPIVHARHISVPVHTRIEQPKKSALSYGMNKTTEAPPPIPTASRPDLAALQNSKPKMSAALARSISAHVCMKCRDFSGPDNHAARFPRQAIPSTDLNWLATQLTSPFPSATDKARAIFTWLHHNIDYNCEAFFSKNIKPSTPNSTFITGLAVCEGYAALYSALAIHAGLESVVIVGHGAGFGYKTLQPGDPVPPCKADGHAWNAVKIDDSEWKLIDSCWGAGHLGDDQRYHRQFHPECFIMSNEDFGLKHYPSSTAQQFRNDGRIMSWEEYIRGPDGPGENLTIFSGCLDEHGLDEKSILPRKQHIKVGGQARSRRLGFQFKKYCDHWDNERMGRGKMYVFILMVGGSDGRNRHNIPFETDGKQWWLECPITELGTPGQTINLYAVTSIDGVDGRGWSVADYNAAVGRKGMGFGGVASWQLI